MKKAMSANVILTTVVFAVAITLAASAPSSDSPLTGTWQCQAHGGSLGDMNFTLNLQQNGEDVTGSVSSPLGEAAIASATFKNNKLSIRIEGQDTEYILTATYSGGKLAGEWHKPDGDKGTWQGEKSKQ